MNLTDLLDEFNVVIDTADGLTELRSLILGLAVRGKLVPQDSKDEPASELLKKIEREKQQLYEKTEISKPKKLKALSADEQPFSIPDNWTWTKLELIGITQTGTTPKTSKNEYYGDFIPFIGPGDLLNGDIDYSNRGLSKKGLEVGRLIKKNSILMVCIGGSIGKSHLIDREVSCNQQINTITPLSDINSYFVLSCLTSNYFQNLINEKSTGSATPILNRTKWGDLPIPLPPLAEQRRIVQKIESLFAEVDELEAKLNRQTKLDEKLQMAVNAEVQKAPDTEASKSAWSFITSNFETLYHTPEAIDNLKKNILNEAVRGKLVPQDPNDEPASELLKKIEAEKQRLYDEGEIRKPKDLPPVEEDEIPFEIPESWVWTRFGEYALDFNTGLQRSRKEQEPDKEYPYLKMNNITNDGGLLTSDIVKVDADKEEVIQNRLNEGDLLFNTRNSVELVGKTCVVRDLEGVYLYNNNILRVDFNGLMIPEYVNYWFISSLCKFLLNQITSATTNVAAIYQKDLLKLHTPIPPLEEQHRIVRRIEELFAICDRFKAQLEQRQAVNERLVKGLVGEVLEGDYHN
jgi:type I restriction enzyme S subunit